MTASLATVDEQFSASVKANSSRAAIASKPAKPQPKNEGQERPATLWGSMPPTNLLNITWTLVLYNKGFQAQSLPQQVPASSPSP